MLNSLYFFMHTPRTAELDFYSKESHKSFQKKPRDRMDHGAKNWLDATNQRSSLHHLALATTVSGCQPPPSAL